MDAELRCNRLTCRKTLIDKAVVVSPPAVLLHFCLDPDDSPRQHVSSQAQLMVYVK